MRKKLIAVIFAAVMIIASSCSAYEEHSTDIESVVGVWYLDSYYVNTKATPCNDAKLTLKEDNTGSYTEYTMIVTGTDEAGDDILERREETKSASYSGSNGVINLTLGDSTVTYEFNVDEASGDFHLIATDEAGDIIHYVYLSEAAYQDEISTREEQ